MKRWPWMVAVALVSTAVFSPGLSARFALYDDSLYLNRHMMDTPGLAGLRMVWDSSPSWNGDFIEFFPLRDTVYWLLAQLPQHSPFPFHITNLFFHILASILVGIFAERLGVRRGLAALAALIFAIHPIHVESAIWIAGLKDPLCLTLILASLLALQRYRRDERARWYGLSLVALVAALLVKSVAFVVPGIMMLMLILTEPRMRFWKALKLCVAPAIIAGIFLVQFVLIGKINGALVPPHGGTWASHYILSAWAQVLYFKQAIFPSDFQLIYCHFPAQPPWDFRLWVAIALTLAFGLVTWRMRRNRWYFFLVGWYVLFLIPVSNLIPFPALMADRYLYYSIFSICIGYALLLDKMPKLRFTVVPLVLIMAWVSFERSHAWRDEELLWQFAASDPACMEDTLFPASQVYMMASATASTPQIASNTLRRLILAASVTQVAKNELCRSVAITTFNIAQLGHKPDNEMLGHFLATYCKSDGPTWAAQTMVHIGRLPLVAAQAAERAFALDRTPQNALLRALARVSVGDTSPANFIPAIILEYPAQSCRLLDTWLTLSPMDAPRFELPIALCSKNIESYYSWSRAQVRVRLYPDSQKYLEPRYWVPINFFKSKQNKS